MSSNIILKKPGDSEEEENKLPRGVRAMVIGDRIVFVRSVVGRLMPVSVKEQERLESKHIL